MGFKSVLQDIGIGSNAAIGPDFDPMRRITSILCDGSAGTGEQGVDT